MAISKIAAASDRLRCIAASRLTDRPTDRPVRPNHRLFAANAATQRLVVPDCEGDVKHSDGGKRVIVVFGATGAQGGGVVDHLLSDGLFAVRGVTRNATSEIARGLASRGVQMVEADVGNPASYAAGSGVFDGAYGAFILTNYWDPSSTNKEVEQGKALIDAAEACGVTHVQYTALPDVQAESGNKYEVRAFTDKAKVFQYARTKRFTFTSFPAAAFYYQNFINFFPPKKNAATGELEFTLPETSTITAFDVHDLGGVALASFKDPRRWNGEMIACGGDHMTPADYVSTFANVTGQRATLRLMPRAEFAQLGFPGAAETAEMFGWFDDFSYYGKFGKREEAIRAFPAMKTFRQWLLHSGWKG